MRMLGSAHLLRHRLLNTLRHTNGETLVTILEETLALDLHAKGQLDWVQQNLNEIVEVLIHPYVPKINPVKCYRCDIAVLREGDGVGFWADVTPARLRRLPAVTNSDVLRKTAVSLMK